MRSPTFRFQKSTSSTDSRCRSHSSPLSADPWVSSPAPQQGQKFSRPLVSHPHTGHLLTGREPPVPARNSGKSRNKKKNGKPKSQQAAVSRSDPARRATVQESFIQPRLPQVPSPQTPEAHQQEYQPPR